MEEDQTRNDELGETDGDKKEKKGRDIEGEIDKDGRAVGRENVSIGRRNKEKEVIENIKRGIYRRENRVL